MAKACFNWSENASVSGEILRIAANISFSAKPRLVRAEISSEFAGMDVWAPCVFNRTAGIGGDGEINGQPSYTEPSRAACNYDSISATIGYC